MPPSLQPQVNKNTTFVTLFLMVNWESAKLSKVSLFIYHKIPAECLNKMGLNPMVLR